jgi:PAS domain S-box-containing protein
MTRDADTLSARERPVADLLLQAAFEHAPTAIALLDLTGRVGRVNAAFERLIGAGRATLAGIELSLLTDRAVHPDLGRALQFLVRDGQARRLEVRLVPRSGPVRWCLLHLGLIRAADGRPDAAIATLEDISDRRSAEEQMQASAERYRLLVDRANDIFFSIDLEGRFTFVNPMACRLMQFRADELVGKLYLDLIRPDYRSDAEQFYTRQVRQRLSSTYYEFPAVTSDGTEVWLGQSVQLIFDGDRVVSAQAVARDITARRRTEDRLRESEARYRTLAEAARDQIFIIDRDDRIAYVNRCAAEQFHVEPDQIVGRERRELFPSEMASRQGQSLQTIFDTGRSSYIETLTEFPGRMIWLGTQLAPIKDADGRVTSVLGVSRDITEQKRTEEALRASEERLRAVVSNAPLILWAADRDGRFALCVGQGLKDLGLESDQVVGRPVRETYRHSRIDEYLGRALAGETFRAQMILDGRAFDVWFSPSRTGQGAMTGVIGVAVDVTEPTRLQEQLLYAEKMEAIGRLAGGVAHDFNNQLTAILGYAEMLAESLDDEDPRRLDVQEIVRAGERAAAFTEQLLAFGRRQPRKLKVVDLNAIIRRLEQLLRRTVRENIEFELVLEAGLDAVRADPTQLEQIITNLALNARDAMSSSGRLTITTANVTVAAHELRDRAPMPPGRYVMLSVADTGRGMDPEIQSHLFEPFFTTKGEGKGTGLGLASVYGIVKQSGGYIWVTSEVDRGTTFRVYLPPVDAPAEPIEPAVMVSKPVGGSETILVVEDDPTVRAMACVVLSGHGYRVLEAASGGEALQLEQVYDGQIDLLLTDVVMPGMNGRELAIQFADRRPSAKVLYTTGYAKDTFRQELVGGRNLLEKPFVPAGLLHKIRDVLGPADE